MAFEPFGTGDLLILPGRQQQRRGQQMLGFLRQRPVAQMPRLYRHAATVFGKGAIETELGHMRRQPLVERRKVTAFFIFPRLQLKLLPFRQQRRVIHVGSLPQ